MYQRNYLNTLSSCPIKVDGESIQVDTQLLFQRLVLAAKTDLEKAFEYELSTIPKSLFEAPELFYEAHKSTLAETIWTVTGSTKDMTHMRRSKVKRDLVSAFH